MPIRSNWYNIVQVLSLLPDTSTWLFYPLLKMRYCSLLLLLVLYPAAAAAAAAKSLQLCPALCDPIGGLPPGSSVHGIFQARVLEWGAIAFSDEELAPHNNEPG